MISSLSNLYRAATLACGLALSMLCPVQADWMLISNSGVKPNRSAVYVDIESMREVPTESGWRTILEADPGEERDRLFRRRLAHDLEVVEVLESPDGPESRTLLVTVEPEEQGYRVARGLAWGRDGSCSELEPSGWKRVEPGMSSELLRFATTQPQWKEALLTLLRRAQREKNLSEQMELMPFRYEYVQAADSSTLGEITRKYVWTDADPVTLAPTLSQAKQQRGPLMKATLPATSRLEGVAQYFYESRLEDGGWKTPPVGTSVFLYPMAPEVVVTLAVKKRVDPFDFGVTIPDIARLGRETKTLDDEGRFVFEGLQPGLYVVEVQVPHDFIMTSSHVEEVIEERAVYEDGSYDVIDVEEVRGYSQSWQRAPGNWTLDVVDVGVGPGATRMLLSNVRSK